MVDVDFPMDIFYENELEGKTFIIDVTREDIENGIPRVGKCCPVSLAICRALKIKSEWGYVYTDERGIISFYSYMPIMEFNDEIFLQYFVDAFDNGDFVRPFSLILKW